MPRLQPLEARASRAAALYLTVVAASFTAAAEQFDPLAELRKFDVVWDSPGRSWNDTMPLGNGEIGVNAWWEEGGDLRLLIARTDAWDELGRLVKVGMVRIHLDPNPVAAGAPFRQALLLAEGAIEFSLAGGAGARLWVDAHRPLIHFEVSAKHPIGVSASLDLWRNQPRTIRYGAKGYFGDPAFQRPGESDVTSLPDTVLGAGPVAAPHRIGWLHDNGATDWYEKSAKLQGLDGFEGLDPLEGRVFGGIVDCSGARRANDGTLVSAPSSRHRFDIAVITAQPSTPVRWVETAREAIDDAAHTPIDEHRAVHQRWWTDFWNRSWIFVSGKIEEASNGALVPANAHPLRLGQDQKGGSRFTGEFGRVSLFARALDDAAIARLASAPRDQAAPPESAPLFSGSPPPAVVATPEALASARALTLEAWIKPAAEGPGGGRILDKVTPGGGDGMLFDTHPGRSLRLIIGRRALGARDVLRAGQWSHVAAVADRPDGTWRLFVDGREVAGDGAPAEDIDAATAVTRGYILQRWLNACAGRGALPIKFNGSLFTVPTADAPETWKDDPDYRRWGSGYWWQNTRLPCISACAAGDFEMMLPMFRMYAGDTLEVAKYRNRHHLKQPGAFLNECSYFWGHAFNECYGGDRPADLPPGINKNEYHRWEFTCGYELAWMMLDYYEHTGDEKFLAENLLPFAAEILTFYDARYPDGHGGRIAIRPAQALETWWDCTNPMPDIAGLTAVTQRLIDLCAGRMPEEMEHLVRRLRGRMPPLPTCEANGVRMLAPAEMFDRKHNIENPDLYAVFPFRLVAIGRPGIDLGISAFGARKDKGNFGWRQDDIFAAYLGLADEASRLLSGRARRRHAASRFPAFWGPNYDWIPDQDHGAVLMKALQAMLMQTDGRAIHLLPAWPKGWDARFKLHAPCRTTLDGRVAGGRIETLTVSPESRRADIQSGRRE